MTLTPSDRVASVPPSGIRRFFELAEEMDDVISLGVGEPDFSAPWAAREAAISALERGRTSYTANRGKRELRAAIAANARRWDLDYDPDEEVLVTAGASEAIDVAFRALVDPGDTVAVAQPCYVSYTPGVTFSGGEVLDVPTRADDEFELTPEVLYAAGADEADLLVYCYPNNPTGATMNRPELADVAEFCREHDVDVLADEIYADLTYEGDHVSIAEFEGMRERTVVFNGFSKTYAMTGLRLGYAMATGCARARPTPGPGGFRRFRTRARRGRCRSARPLARTRRGGRRQRGRRSRRRVRTPAKPGVRRRGRWPVRRGR